MSFSPSSFTARIHGQSAIIHINPATGPSPCRPPVASPPGKPLPPSPAPTRRALLTRVITSYSIHYTKLYELWFSWRGPLDPAGRFYYRVHGPRLLIEYNRQDANRITSYNVCYTKLLRTIPRLKCRIVAGPANNQLARDEDGNELEKSYNFV